MLGSLASERAAVRDGCCPARRQSATTSSFDARCDTDRRKTLGIDRAGTGAGAGDSAVRHYEIVAEITEPVCSSVRSRRHLARTQRGLLSCDLVRYGLKPMALIHTDASEACRLLRECSEHSLAGCSRPHCSLPQATARRAVMSMSPRIGVRHRRLFRVGGGYWWLAIGGSPIGMAFNACSTGMSFWGYCLAIPSAVWRLSQELGVGVRSIQWRSRRGSAGGRQQRAG